MIEIVSFETLDAVQREAAAQILNRALAHMPSGYSLDEARDEVRACEGKSRIAFGALEQGVVRGWIGAIPSYSHAWELHPLVVDPEHQRKGIGSRLCEYLEDHAWHHGVVTLHLGTDDDYGGTNLFGVDLYPDPLNKLSAIAEAGGHPFAFYRKLGWSVTGVIPDANGPGRPDILMAKRIG